MAKKDTDVELLTVLYAWCARTVNMNNKKQQRNKTNRVSATVVADWPVEPRAINPVLGIECPT